MTETLYKIKPFQWEKKSDEFCERYNCGHYSVVRYRKDLEPHLPWESWRWEYQYIEYYDEGSKECASAAEGKRLAWEHWLERLKPSLIEAKGD